MLKISYRHDEDITILDMSGTIDVDAEDTIKHLTEISSDGSLKNLLWNLKEIESISSSGVAILLNAYAEIKKQDRINKLIHVGPKLLQVFQVHKVLPAFDIFPNEASAKKQILVDSEEREKAYKRLFERITVELKAKFKLATKGVGADVHKFHSGEATSLSMCGIYLHTDYTHPTDTLVEVKLVLPGGFFRPHVKFLAKVAWEANPKDHVGMYPGMALCILFMAVKEKAKLEKYLHELGV
jgi:anti-anti-sigma factor